MNTYEAKQKARRDRYNDLAQKADEEAMAKSAEGFRLSQFIPPGQPIHVGHYGEKADRRFRAKVDNTYRRCHELRDQADQLREKAKTVGQGGISSYDPDAIKKLEEKCAKEIESWERDKLINKLSRKADRDGLAALGYSQEEIETFIQNRGIDGHAFTMSYHRAKVKRLRARIDMLTKMASREEKEVTGKGYTYQEDPSENRIMFIFEGKPDSNIRSILKSHSFKWSPTRGAWVRMLNDNALYAAKQVMKSFNQL